LRPERVVDYEVGFQQLLSQNSAIKFSAYYRELRDMIQERTYLFVPVISNYQTYGNIDFGTVKGFTVQYDLRRVKNIEFRLAYTLQFADGTEELVPLGVFILTTVEITDTPEGVRINVQGSDRSLRVIRAKWTNHDFYIDDATAKETAIEQILKDRYPAVQTIFPATNQVTDIIYPTLDQSSNPWKEALKIAESAGMDLYFDENGTVRMRPIPDPDNGLPTVTYEDNTESVVTSLNRSLSSDETFNHVVFTGEGTNLSIGVLGEAKDLNPASPTYIETYGSVPIFKSSPYILTVAEAEEAAIAELRKVIGALEKISWDQIVNPAHDVYDLVKVTRTPSGVDATLMLDSITIPLSPQNTMNAIGRSRRF
jgi:hypothetical protein